MRKSERKTAGESTGGGMHRHDCCYAGMRFVSIGLSIRICHATRPFTGASLRSSPGHPAWHLTTDGPLWLSMDDGRNDVSSRFAKDAAMLKKKVADLLVETLAGAGCARV